MDRTIFGQHATTVFENRESEGGNKIKILRKSFLK